MKRKMILIILVIASITMLGILAGCRSEDTATPAVEAPDDIVPEAPAPTPPTPAPGEVEDEPEPEPEPFDFGGMLVRIASWWTPLHRVDHADPARVAQYWQMRELEYRYNIEFYQLTMTANDIRDGLRASAMAGDVFAEIIFQNFNNVPHLITNNMIRPLNEVMDPFAEPWNPSAARHFTDEDGNTWATSPFVNAIESLIWFNVEIFERFGLENPQVLYQTGRWDADAFRYLALATTRDLTGDGTNDIYGFASTLGHTLQQLIAMFGTQLLQHDENGRVVSGLRDPRNIRALEFVHNMFMVDRSMKPIPDGAGSGWSQDEFFAKRVAMIQFSNSNWGRMFENMDVPFSVVPFPRETVDMPYINFASNHNMVVMQAALDDEIAYHLGPIFSTFWTHVEGDESVRDQMAFSAQLAMSHDIETVENINMMLSLPGYWWNSAMYLGSADWGPVMSRINDALFGEVSISSALAEVEPALIEALERVNANLGR